MTDVLGLSPRGAHASRAPAAALWLQELTSLHVTLGLGEGDSPLRVDVPSTWRSTEST